MAAAAAALPAVAWGAPLRGVGLANCTDASAATEHEQTCRPFRPPAANSRSISSSAQKTRHCAVCSDRT